MLHIQRVILVQGLQWEQLLKVYLDSLVHYIDLKREITVNVVYFLHVEVFCIKINNILKMIIIELKIFT